MLMHCSCRNVWEASENKRGHGIATEHDGSCPICGKTGRPLTDRENRVRRALQQSENQRLREARHLLPPPEALVLFGLRFHPMNSDGSGGKVKKRIHA